MIKMAHGELEITAANVGEWAGMSLWIKSDTEGDDGTYILLQPAVARAVADELNHAADLCDAANREKQERLRAALP